MVENSSSPHCQGVATALDIPQADDYLLSLLLPRGLSLFQFSAPSTANRKRVLELVIKMLLQGATLYATALQTPATRALGLQLVEDSAEGGAVKGQPRMMRPETMVKWMVLSVILPRIYELVELWLGQARDASSHSGWNSLEEQSQQPQRSLAEIAMERRIQVARRVLDFFKRTVPLLRVCTLLSFWKSSRSTTSSRRFVAPGLAVLLAGLQYQRIRPVQRIHVAFAHRRWLYEEFIRTLQVASPASSLGELVSLYDGLLEPLKSLLTKLKHRLLPVRPTTERCLLCGLDPMRIPCVTNCGHVFCYTCLWTATAERHTHCYICGAAITSCRRCTSASGTTDTTSS